MKIGFDLDNIFIAVPPFIPAIFFEWGYKEKDNGELRYRIPSSSGQLVRKILHLPQFRPPIQKNLAFLRTISQKDHELYLISSRYHFLEKRTKALVKKHHLAKYFRQMYFNFANRQPHFFKNEVLKKLKLDIYIDDDLSLLKYVAKENPQTTFYWLYPKKTDKILPKNILKIEKLEEVLK